MNERLPVSFVFHVSLDVEYNDEVNETSLLQMSNFLASEKAKS